MKNTIVIFIFLIIGCNGNDLEKGERVIIFDSKKRVENYDLKDITDSSFLIVPLETNDNCLISKIDKIEIRNEQIYILDILSSSVFIFNLDGKYVGKINSIGQGPGEYTAITNITVTDSSIIVIDRFSLKQIEYSTLTLKSINEERILTEIWANDIFTLPGCIYYINNWSETANGKYRLFSRKDNNKEFIKMLPFKESPVDIECEGIQYSINKNEVLLTYTGSDILFRLKNNEISPEYRVQFEDKKVLYPDGKAENVFNNNVAGLVIGIGNINESEKYLFFNVYFTGGDVLVCMYNKETQEEVIFNYAFDSTFDNEQIVVDRIIDNKLITCRDASTLLLLNEYAYSERIFKNKEYENRFNAVVSNLTDEANPVLFIYNLR